MEQIHIKIKKTIEPHSKIIGKIPFLVLTALILLLPVFVLPLPGFSLLLSKHALLLGGILLTLIAWTLLRLSDGVLVIPRSPWCALFVLVPLATLVSFFVSPAKATSLWGSGSEVDSLFSTLLLFAVLFLIPSAFRTKNSLFTGYVTFFISFLLFGLFYAVRSISVIYGGDVFSFGIFNDITANPLGKWNEIALFGGAALVLSTFTFYFLRPPLFSRLLLWLIVFLSIALSVIVNFIAYWYVVGIFGLMFLVYGFFVRQKLSRESVSSASAEETPLAPTRWASALSLVVLIVAIVFIVDSVRTPGFDGRTPLAGSIARALSVNQLEVRPSWQSTFEVVEETLKERPAFGAGPTRFVRQWLLHKPESVNANLFFWDIDFAYGVGLIPTFFATTGLLGGLSWVFFFAALLYFGFRYAIMPHDDKALRYLTVSSFFTSVFLWIFTVLYVPGTVLYALAFVFTGFFIAALYQHETFLAYHINLFKNPSMGFVSALALVLVLLGSLTGLYVLGKDFIASISFQRAGISFNAKGDIVEAEKYILRALKFDDKDVYERAAAELGIVKLRNILATKGITQEVLAGEFQRALGETIDHAREASTINAGNYQNWVTVARVYQELVPAIEGSYAQADAAYSKALSLNPHNPALYLLRARLEVAHGNTTKAREYIDGALKEKENYTAAIFLRSQIESSEGKVKDAILSAEKASLIAPNDIGILFQIGLLKYNNRDYKGTVVALERAVGLNREYANARYFLGLSYYRLGDQKKAAAQFEEIQKTNTDNAEVKLILSNLKAGRSPFADAKPPIDDAPEKRSKLPIEEGSKKAESSI